MAAEVPDVPPDPAEDLELDNEDEEEAGGEDAADGNNGAQGTSPPNTAWWGKQETRYWG